MPMGNVSGKTNCRCCIDCEPMINLSNNVLSYRCYGQYYVPIKRDFSVGESQPPRIAPRWCPNRSRNRRAFRKRCERDIRKGKEKEDER